ncbi:hypothetical protein GCM10010195_14240 [Kitasatospora griseola]|nr:hypothetical protein GCM10010195_14240 [Kitasatospora griseola]
MREWSAEAIIGPGEGFGHRVAVVAACLEKAFAGAPDQGGRPGSPACPRTPLRTVHHGRRAGSLLQTPPSGHEDDQKWPPNRWGTGAAVRNEGGG